MVTLAVAHFIGVCFLVTLDWPAAVRDVTIPG
jgi:hypothetical protein